MKELIFNDGRSLEIQSAQEVEGNLKVRVILTTSEQLKALFLDEFATQRMTLLENHKEQAVFENYYKPSLKEEYGGVWEVELIQKEKDTATLIKNLQNELADTKRMLDLSTKDLETANQQITDLQLAMCEIYEGNASGRAGVPVV